MEYSYDYLSGPTMYVHTYLFMHFFIHLERILCVRATMDAFHRHIGLSFLTIFTLIINKKSCNNVNLTLWTCIKVNIQRKNYKWIPSSTFFKFQMTKWLKLKTFLFFNVDESITQFLKKMKSKSKLRKWQNSHTYMYVIIFL